MGESSSLAVEPRPPAQDRAAPDQPADRRRPDLATSVVVLLALAGMALTVADGPLVLRAPLVAAAMLAAPGLALLPRAGTLRGVGRAAAVVPLSLTVETLVALAMIWTGTWHPRVAGSALLLLSAVTLGVRGWRASGRRGRGATGAPAATSAASRSSFPSTGVGWAALVAAALLWIVTLRGTTPTDLGEWGLLPALPPAWFVALALTLGSLLWGILGRQQPPGRLLAAHLSLLVLILYGTASLLEDAPRLPWVYKHIAVTRYLELHGTVDPTIDLYQRWPGFFALTAQLGDLTGLPDPVSWAALAEPGFALVDVLLVLALTGALSTNRRWCWTATLLFSVSNWVAQNYFAPQALGYTLALFLALLLVTALSSAPRPAGLRLERLATRLLRVPVRPDAPKREPAGVVDGDTAPTPLTWTVVVSMAALAAVVASHQLTPYLLLLAFAPLFLLGYLRPLLLVVGMAAVTGAYLVPNLDYVQSHFGLFSGFDPLANAVYSPVDRSTLLPGAVWQARGTQLISGLMYLLALVGLVRRARRGAVRPALIVGWLMVAPVLVLAGQTYGGEGRLRVYLFSLPWCAMAAAWAFWPGEAAARPGRRVSLALTTAVLVLASLFTMSYLQPEDDYRVPRTDVTAAQWLDQTARRGDVVLTTSPTFPLLVGPHYDNLGVGGPLGDYQRYFPQPLSVADLSTIAVNLTRPAEPGRIFVVFSDHQDRYDRRHGVFAPGELAGLENQIRLASGDQRAYDSGAVRIYRIG